MTKGICRTAGEMCGACGKEIQVGTFKTWGKYKSFHLECTKKWYAAKKQGESSYNAEAEAAAAEASYTQAATERFAQEIIETTARTEAPKALPPAPLAVDGHPLLSALEQTIRQMAQQTVDEQKVRAIVTEALGPIQTEIRETLNRAPREVIVTRAEDAKAVNVGLVHKQFDQLLRIMNARVWCFIVGPAGGGKTHAAEQAAKALGLEFYFDGRTDADYKILGFEHPSKGPTMTPFKMAYTMGGVYLADEFDGWEAQASLALQAALANAACPFPGDPKPLPMHKDFVFVAAGNTWGYGADSQYVGRNKLDAATLNRFGARLAWEYDLNLERAISGNDSVCTKIQLLRQRAQDRGIKVVISPRNSVASAKLVAAGYSERDAIELSTLNGLSKSDRNVLTEGIQL